MKFLFIVLFLSIFIPNTLSINKTILTNCHKKSNKINEVTKNMSFNKDHIRGLIEEILFDLEPAIPFSKTAVELLMLTSAQESHLGRELRQIGIEDERNGALGIFQIEIKTFNDIWDRDLEKSNDNFLSYKKHLELLINKYYNHNLSLEMNLKGNIPLQIVVARLIYYRVKPALPHENDIIGIAEYYKKHFNTYLGAATVEKAIANYNRFCI